jgi:hypothetical protein
MLRNLFTLLFILVLVSSCTENRRTRCEGGRLYVMSEDGGAWISTSRRCKVARGVGNH